MSEALDTAPGAQEPLGSYRLDDKHDEAFDPGGEARPHYVDLLAGLRGADLGAMADAVNADLAERRVVFGGGSGARAFLVDPVPRILDSSEWAPLARGLEQRARALGAFVEDVYHECAIVEDGVVPASVLEGCERYEPWMKGVPVPRAGFVSGLDVVRGGDHVLRVLEDNARTPSGIAFATAAREAVDRRLPRPAPASRLAFDRAYELLGRSLRGADPTGGGDPSIVLLSDGASNSAWYEHRALAEHLGVPLVAPDELTVCRGRLRTWVDGEAPREVQVVYRRTEEDRLRNADGSPTWLADALLDPCRRGNLAVVNPLGSGVADDKLSHAYVEDMVRFYLGEDPLIPSVPTLDLSEPGTLDAALDRIRELVIKPRTGHGGTGVVVCAHAGDEERARVARAVRDSPRAYVAQETVSLSRHPTVIDGRLEPRHVDLRPFVFGAGAEAEAAPGGLTRVAFEADSLVVNSSRNGGGKDTWALA